MRKKVTIGLALLLSLSLLAACGGVPQEDLDAAVAAKTAAEAKVTSLTSQLAAAQSAATKAQSDLAAAQAELATAQSDLEAAQDEAASAKSAASSAQSAATKAKSDLAAAEATVAALEATVAELEAAAAATEEEEVVEEEEEVAEEEEEEVAEEEEEAVELTFTPAEYVNEEYGFSVKYPNAWYEEEAEGDTVYVAVGPPYTIPGVSISVSDITEGVSYADGLAADQEEAGNTDIEIVSVTETTLADGTTPATLVVLTYFDTGSGNPIDAVSIGVEVDGKRITVFVYTVEMYAPFSLEQKTEVCMTLTLQ